MGYPYVQARHDYGPLRGPALALVIHMAEGGGTVGYLANDPARGVSVHFVCEYSGRIVQMLGLERTSGSINPGQLRTDDGPPPYGASVARSVLGHWYTDPNSAILTMEVEGYAARGPNVAQRASMALWADDMRLVVPTLTGALGHRDFQDYKACPGAHIDWPSLGGHGLWPTGGPNQPEEPMIAFPAYDEPHVVDLPAGTKLYTDSDLGTVRETLGAARTLPYIGSWTPPGQPIAHIVVHGAVAEYLRASDMPKPPYLRPVVCPDFEPVTDQLYREVAP